MEEEELRLAIALSASEAPPEALIGKGQSPGHKRRRGQKQLQAPPPLASLSTSQVKRRIEHRIEQVLVNKVSERSEAWCVCVCVWCGVCMWCVCGVCVWCCVCVVCVCGVCVCMCVHACVHLCTLYVRICSLRSQPLVSDGLCTQTTPELPQSKLVGRGVRHRGRGPGLSRTSPPLFGGSEREGSSPQGGGDGGECMPREGGQGE